MKEKIANSIAQRQNTILELTKIKEALEDAVNKETKFVMETLQFGGYFDMSLFRRKDKIPVSNYTMNLVLDELIKKEKEYIDKLIDMEIERVLKKRGKKEKKE